MARIFLRTLSETACWSRLLLPRGRARPTFWGVLPPPLSTAGVMPRPWVATPTLPNTVPRTGLAAPPSPPGEAHPPRLLPPPRPGEVGQQVNAVAAAAEGEAAAERPRTGVGSPPPARLPRRCGLVAYAAARRGLMCCRGAVRAWRGLQADGTPAPHPLPPPPPPPAAPTTRTPPATPAEANTVSTPEQGSSTGLAEEQAAGRSAHFHSSMEPSGQHATTSLSSKKAKLHAGPE